MDNKNYIFITSDSADKVSLSEISENKPVITSNLKLELSKLMHIDIETIDKVILLTTIDILRDAYHDLKPNLQQLGKIAAIVLDDNFNLSDPFIDMNYIIEFRNTKISGSEYSFIIDKAFHFVERRQSKQEIEASYKTIFEDMKRDQEDLINIGRSLSIEKDPNKLFRLILFLSKKITGADAGSIYIVEEDENGKKRLRFKYSHTFSKEVPIEEFTMPLDKNSIAGYVAITGDVLNIPDAHLLTDKDPISFNKNFDITHGYHSKSMLVVPMRNHIGEIIGVIQLINSKEDLYSGGQSTGNEAFEIRLVTKKDFDELVVTFDKRYEKLMEAVAGQAAVAIENNRLIKQIQNQFEEFVKASVTAIESRDPATSGHSFRVAEICREMALAINEEQTGKYAEINFSQTQLQELEYASLLHDFGKVYIDLAIFKKSKKLFPAEFTNLILKFDYLYRYTELEYSQRELELLMIGSDPDENKRKLAELKKESDEILSKISQIKKDLTILNEPTVTDFNPADKISEINSIVDKITCIDIDGSSLTILTDDEKKNLGIPRGSLNNEERLEIESHVIHTYNFVKRIPWPPEYRNIPEIVVKHHEKLDGTGYPYQLKECSIPIEAQMMALADIYDALTASDRPYKRAIPHEKAVFILQKEAENHKINSDLLDIFIRYNIADKITAHPGA